MDELALVRSVITAVDDARRYVAKCREMEDEDIPDDFIENAVLAALRGEPYWVQPADLSVPGLDEIKVRIQPVFKNRIEAYVDRHDVYIRSVSFPVGQSQTVAEILASFERPEGRG